MTERERRAADGQPETFAENNLYPDARPCLSDLQQMGLSVGLAGNQTTRTERILKSLHQRRNRWRLIPPSCV